MTGTRRGADDGEALRRQAEERLKARGGRRETPIAADEAERVLHELRVHQIELEMQNEELRAAQESLVAERGRYFDLFDLAPIGYLTLGTEGAILEANLTVSSLLGVTRGELAGKPFTHFIVPDDQDVYYLHRRRLESEGRAEACELRLVQSGGETRWVALSTVVAREPDGTPVWRTVIHDVSVRKRIEAELERERARVAEAEKLEAVGRLAGGVAHNFNNILQALSSLSALLGMRSAAPGTEGIVKLIGAQVTRGAALARQLLFFSPDEPVTRRSLDLRRLIESMVPALHAVLPESVRLAVDVSDTPEMLLVEGEAGQLEQVVLNLVLNARDAMPSGGMLSIRTFAREEFVVLEVSDTGRGMDETTREHLFEPFVTTKEAKSASVRGLAVAYGVVQRQGGRIEVESGPDRGSLLRIVLPAATLVVDSREERSGTELVSGNGERLLIVEDEDVTREGLADVLGLLGYEVVSARSGEDALALPADVPPDLVLCDVLLPGIAGPALVEELRVRWPGIGVILMSGYTADIVIRLDSAGKAVRFLQKPFDMARLSRELRAELDER